MKNIEINERMNERDTVASIGIGAMIVFIALVLVAAVASAVIIQTGEKLQQNAQQTGSDTQQEIGGKISIIAVWVGDQTGGAEQITVVFETSAGSDVIPESTVLWNVVCDDGAATPVALYDEGDFGAATLLDAATAPTDDLFDQGAVYMIDLTVANCMPATVGVEVMFLIMVEGGGTTYETLMFTSITEGDAIV
jgi:flagellin FlaB